MAPLSFTSAAAPPSAPIVKRQQPPSLTSSKTMRPFAPGNAASAAGVQASVAATSPSAIPAVSPSSGAMLKRARGSESTRSGASLTAMATPSASQPTPQRLAAIREQVSLLADYL